MTDASTQPETAPTGGASRTVLALLMALLLGLATAVAVALASTGQARRTPTLTETTVGSFTLSVPAAWETLIESNGQNGPPALQLAEGAGYRRVLTVTQLTTSNGALLPPRLLGGAAAKRLGLPAAVVNQIKDPRLGRRSRAGPIVAATFQARTEGAGGDPQHHLFTIATVDGRRHLVISATASTYAWALNHEIVEQLLATVTDTRYAVVDGPWMLDGATVEPIDGLLALRRTSGSTDANLILVPAEAPRYIVLQALPLDVSEPFDLTARIAAADEVDRVPIDMLTALDPSLQTTPAARLISAMYWRFWLATGVEPDALPAIDERRRVYAMVLHHAEPPPMFRALFGVLRTETESAVIELVAEPSIAEKPDESTRTVALGFVQSLLNTLGGGEAAVEASERSGNVTGAAEAVDPDPGRADDEAADDPPSPPPASDPPDDPPADTRSRP